MITRPPSGDVQKLRGHGTLSEANIKDALRDVRLSLEADVNFRVVKEFVKTVKERAVGQAVLESLSPYQDFIRIVSEELTATMGGQAVELDFKRKPPVVILMMGLQGSGKTTTCGKLAFAQSRRQASAFGPRRYSKACRDSAAEDRCQSGGCRVL